jgi:pyridoxine 5-phosphate synthase
LLVLKESVHCKLNLELAAHDEVVRLACQIKPDQATLVPERREEVTTEGGLDVVRHWDATAQAVKQLQSAAIAVSLFLDAELPQIEAAARLGVTAVELHTGKYALARGTDRQEELQKLIRGGRRIRELGMALHAGHGLHYQNVRRIAQIEGMHELNIGHSIIARAIMVGMLQAVREMKDLIQ